MMFELDPEPGQWYVLPDNDEAIRVVSVDQDDLSIQILFSDGEIIRIEFAEWEVLDAERSEQPEGWEQDDTVGEEELEADDEGQIEAGEMDVDGEQDEDDDEDEWDEDDDDESGEEEDLIDEDEDGDELGESDTSDDDVPGNEWTDLLRVEVEAELALQSRKQKRRASLAERRLKVQSAVREMLGDYFAQISREPGVFVIADTGPPISYSVEIQGSGDWVERVEMQEGAAKGSWRVLTSSGEVIKKLADLEQYIKGHLTKQLARQLAPLRAEQLREDRRTARANERERKLAEERKLQVAEEKRRERTLDFEARMIARAQPGAREKK